MLPLATMLLQLCVRRNIAMPSLSVCQILSRRFLFLDVAKVHVHVGLGPSTNTRVELLPFRVKSASASHHYDHLASF